MTVMDTIVIIAVLLAFGMATIIGMTVWTSLNASFIATMNQSGDINPYAVNASTNTTNTLAGFDLLFVFLAFGLLLSTVVAAFMIESHPVFFIASLLGFIFVVTLAAVFGNVFFEFQQGTPEVQAAASNYPFMEQFFYAAPTIAMFFGAVLIIVMLAKIRGGGRNAYSP